MNSDESKTPEPAVESSVQELHSIQDNPAADSDAELLLKQEEQSSKVDPVADSAIEWLTELEEQSSTVDPVAPDSDRAESEAAQRVADLQRQEEALKQEIASLQGSYNLLCEQVAQTQTALGRLVPEALSQLEQRKQSLQIATEQLERRQERIRAEMRTTFAGASQDLAIRVQGFKDYLTGSLQDLAAAAEQLELVPKAKAEKAEPEFPVVKQSKPDQKHSSTPQFAEQRFESTTKQIRRLIDQYRTRPDYYGPPWQLRRTFEPVHAERVSNWFFTQGGRGALRTMGSRLQNILIGSAVISVLYTLHSDRLRTLVLANTPERLGEWRRGLQDCLGISRGDFGPERGVVLFETSEAVAVKAERLVKANQLPLIIVDASEDQISLSLLQFPLWLAFAPDPQMSRDYDF
jgi:hypothetical protein